MRRKIEFCLVYRDMWQSAGKYMPTVEQLEKIAPVIIKMGCFSRVETNGGGFEQINLLFGENPNIAVRRWTKPFHEAGIKTQMLERALNGLRLNPVPDDVRELFFKVKKSQGVDIARSFCGLNDIRNIETSIQYAKAAGMISQASLCLTHSPIHTVDYFASLAEQLIAKGADEICLKDMGGIGRPVFLGKLVSRIKEKHPDIPIQYHSHAGPGFNVASILEVCRAGADIIDVGMEPLAWGMGHADVITIREMLYDAGFDVPEINMEAYMEARKLNQEFINDFLGYYINKQNRWMNSLLIKSGLPGGMMGSLMADLTVNCETINKYLKKEGRPTMTIDQLLVALFEEVAFVWPKLGYPPLVTPFSQYVKNIALMNITQRIKGKERWSMIADDVWNMILGKNGKLPGEIAPEIKAIAERENRVFVTENPHLMCENCLDEYREKMKAKGWDFGEDDEELFEYAMHPSQYEAFKSGQAKADFEADLAKRKAPKAVADAQLPEEITVELDGERYRVGIAYGNEMPAAATKTVKENSSKGKVEITAPLEGKFFLVKGAADTPVKVGQHVKKGEIVCYIEAMKTYNSICADADGVVAKICHANGDSVSEDDVLMLLDAE